MFKDPRVVYSLQAALLFALVASPFMYNLVQTLLGRFVTVAKGGCPTMAGLLLHSVVYGILVYLLMVLEPSVPSVVVVSKSDE